MFQLSLLKIFIFLLAAFFIFEAFKKFLKKQKGQTFLKFFIQIFIWSTIGLLIIHPQIAQIISQKMGFGNNLNTLIFLGFVFVFLILFKIIALIERLEQNISEIVRKEALEKITEKQRKQENLAN